MPPNSPQAQRQADAEKEWQQRYEALEGGAITGPPPRDYMPACQLIGTLREGILIGRKLQLVEDLEKLAKVLT